MDEKYLLAAARYIEFNPVRAKLTVYPAAYLWSSAGAHIKGVDDGFVVVKPLLELVDDWLSWGKCWRPKKAEGQKKQIN
jgi:putative transposase